MPFQNAIAQDPHYKMIILERANDFWNLHKSEGAQVDQASPEVKQLIVSMLSKDPSIRPSLNEILYHNWMTNTQHFDNGQIATAL